MAATVELMTEGGLGAATVDAIRDRSGVSKTTIYKHWPNRLCVAVDAFTEQLATGASLPDTGSARGDFAEQVERVSSFYTSALGGVFAQLLAAALQDSEASEWLRQRLLLSRERGVEQLWNRAVTRGEVRTDVEADIAIDLLFGPVMWRLLSGHRALGPGDAHRLTDAALGGLLIRDESPSQSDGVDLEDSHENEARTW